MTKRKIDKKQHATNRTAKYLMMLALIHSASVISVQARKEKKQELSSAEGQELSAVEGHLSSDEGEEWRDTQPARPQSMINLLPQDASLLTQAALAGKQLQEEAHQRVGQLLQQAAQENLQRTLTVQQEALKLVEDSQREGEKRIREAQLKLLQMQMAQLVNIPVSSSTVPMPAMDFTKTTLTSPAAPACTTVGTVVPITQEWKQQVRENTLTSTNFMQQIVREGETDATERTDFERRFGDHAAWLDMTLSKTEKICDPYYQSLVTRTTELSSIVTAQHYADNILEREASARGLDELTRKRARLGVLYDLNAQLRDQKLSPERSLTLASSQIEATVQRIMAQFPSQPKQAAPSPVTKEFENTTKEALEAKNALNRTNEELATTRREVQETRQKFLAKDLAYHQLAEESRREIENQTKNALELKVEVGQVLAEHKKIEQDFKRVNEQFMLADKELSLTKQKNFELSLDVEQAHAERDILQREFADTMRQQATLRETHKELVQHLEEGNRHNVVLQIGLDHAHQEKQFVAANATRLEQLLTAQRATEESLHASVHELTRNLEETHKKNEDLTFQLQQMQEQMQKTQHQLEAFETLRTADREQEQLLRTQVEEFSHRLNAEGQKTETLATKVAELEKTAEVQEVTTPEQPDEEIELPAAPPIPEEPEAALPEMPPAQTLPEMPTETIIEAPASAEELPAPEMPEMPEGEEPF